MASGGQQAVRLGDWKGVRLGIKGDPSAAVQLFNLKADPQESTDVAAQNPDIAARILRIMQEGRTPNRNFPMGALDQENL
jgi:arylsulfatase A-like enzyme